MSITIQITAILLWLILFRVYIFLLIRLILDLLQVFLAMEDFPFNLPLKCKGFEALETFRSTMGSDDIISHYICIIILSFYLGIWLSVSSLVLMKILSKVIL